MLDRIPHEIFSKIVKISYQDFSTSAYLFDDVQPSIPPIEASHVCRSWRVALLSNPTMWTCIKPKFHGRDGARLREMISRSGSALLDVYIEEFGYDPARSQSTSLITTLPLVFREMHRFRKLYILTPMIFAGAISRHLKQPAPMLQYFYFDLHILDHSDTLREAYQNLFLGNAPTVKHVCLHISDGFRELDPALPFMNLSRFHLSFPSRTDIDGDILLDVLRSSPCLRDLKLMFLSGRPTIICSTPLDHHVSLPYLQDLGLKGICVASNLDFILGRLKFPADKVHFDITCDDFSGSKLFIYFLSQRHLSVFSIFLYSGTIDFYENTKPSSPESSLHLAKRSKLSIIYMNRMPLGVLPSLRTLRLSNITHMYLEMIPSGSAVFEKIIPLLENLLHLRVLHEYLYRNGPFDDSSIPGSSFLKALTPSRLQRSTPQSQTQPTLEASSESDTETDTDVDSTDIQVDSSNEASTNQVGISPCPSLHTLEIIFPTKSNLKQNEKRYFKKLTRCCKLREQTGNPIKSVSILCELPILVESEQAWLQANELYGSRVKISMITSTERELLCTAPFIG